MATNIAQIVEAGFERLDYFVLNSNGYAIGSGLTLANGADSGGGRLLGVNTADVSIPDSRIVNATGDDGVIGQFRFAPAEFPSFTISGSVFDQNLDSLAQGTIRHALGDTTWSGLQPANPDFNQFALLLTSQALSQDSGSVGSAGFMTIMIPKATLQPLGVGGLSNAEVAENRYSVSVTSSDIYPFGLAFSDVNNGSTSFSYLYAQTENRLTFHTFIGDGATNSFTLDQTAFSDTDGDKCQIWVDGVAQTITTDFTLSTTAGVTTVTWDVGSVPTAGQVCVAMYEYTL